MNDSIEELILDEGIDLEIIRQDIEDQSRANPDFSPLLIFGVQFARLKA